jgi:hypothetical protein
MFLWSVKVEVGKIEFSFYQIYQFLVFKSMFLLSKSVYFSKLSNFEAYLFLKSAFN